MKVECEYCGKTGTYPTVIELRKVGAGDRTVLACKDRKACDARWEKANPEDHESK